MEFNALLDANEVGAPAPGGVIDLRDDVVDAIMTADRDGSLMPLDEIKQKFRDLVAGVDAMVLRANNMKVVSADDEQAATALGVDAKRLAKLIEARQKDALAPLNDLLSSANNFCALFIDKLVTTMKTVNGKKVVANPDCIEAILKPKILGYQAKVELERRKKEEDARRIKEELQAKLDAEAAELNRKAEEDARLRAIADAKAKGAGAVEMSEAVQAAVAEAKENAVEAPVVPDIIVSQSSAPVRTENGGAAYGAKNWVCTIVDPALVPREFCAPVQKLLNDAVRQGVRSIVGCVIKEEQSLRFRS